MGMEITTENNEAQTAGVQVESEDGGVLGRSRPGQVMKNYVFKEYYLKIRGRIKY